MTNVLHGTIIIPSEKQEHMAFLDWLSFHPTLNDISIHVANEYDGGIVKGANRKRMGVKKGVPDFFFPVPRSPYHGLWIELKRVQKFSISKEQEWWIQKLRKLGYAAYFCYGCNHAIETVKNYFNGDIIHGS